MADIKLSNKSFYYENEFNFWTNQISTYALDIAIENYFGELLNFTKDRIIYASNDFCFRERGRKNDGNLQLPFMNYYRTGYSESDREWFNNYANLIGIMDVANEGYVSTLGTQLKLVPIKAEYEGSIFFSQHQDVEYAWSRLVLEQSNETRLYPNLIANTGNILKNIGIVNFDIEFNPDYNESEWLEQNKIWSISCNFDIDTFFIYGNDNFHIAQEVICEFLTAKNIFKEGIDPHTQLQNYFTITI